MRYPFDLYFDDLDDKEIIDICSKLIKEKVPFRHIDSFGQLSITVCNSNIKQIILKMGITID